MRRKRPPLPFDDYLFRTCSALRDLGGEVDQLFLRASRTGDDVVILNANVVFPHHDLELKVFEVIEKTSIGGAHRLKYSYQARWRERLLVRYDREPVRHPEMPEHRHLADGSKEPCESVRLFEVVDEMWRALERAKKPGTSAPVEDADVA